MARDLNVQSKIVDSDQYVYRQERDLTKTDVDWTTVTKNLTDTIEKVRDDRQTQKAEIETATTEAMGQLAEMEKYDSETLNVKVLEGSEWGSNFLASQNDLMKRGLIKPATFMQSKQKVSDSFTQLKKALGTFDADYIEAQKRMNSKVPGEQSNSFEQAMMGEMSGLSGLAEWDFAGNPATGNMNFVKKGKDPSNPQNLMSLNSINQRLSQKSNYVSLGGSSEAEVDRLGVQIKEVFDNAGGRGSVIGVEDFLQKKGAKGMLDRIVGVVTANDADKISIMQDLGVNNEMYSSDPEEVAANPGDGTVNNPGMVLMVPTGDGQGTLKPQFSPEQVKLIDEEAMVAVKSQLDKKITALKGHQTVHKPQDTPATIGAGDKEATSVGYMRDIIDLTEGDERTAKSAADALASTINKSLGADDAPVTLLERMVDSDGVTLAFQVHRKGMDTTTVNVKDMSPQDAQRALYENVTPEGVLGYHDAVAAWGGESGDAYGEGGVQGRGPTKKMTTLDFERNLEIPGTADSMTAYQYVDSQMGEVFGALNSYDDAVNTYKTVLTSMMPADLFDAIGGSENIEVSFQGDTLVIKIGKGEDMVKKTVSNSSGANDSTRLHLDAIQEAISEARKGEVEKKTGKSSQSNYDEWLAENPSGSFAEWLATQ
tara:strand:+ start:97 stop:2058 length:1962 start_codon:yes stop_codon:yes gene_type:complete